MPPGRAVPRRKQHKADACALEENFAPCFQGRMTDLFRYAATPLMLIFSNVFMTTAWYGHLKFKASPLWLWIWVLHRFWHPTVYPSPKIGSWNQKLP